MHLFQAVQKDFSLLGIAPNGSKFSRKNLVATYSIYGLSTTSSILFIAFEANTFIEYVNNSYMTSAMIMISTYSTFLAIKSAKLFKFIHSIEQFIDERECILNLL